MMIDDEKIIELFFKRSEQGIRKLDIKYGRVCHKLSNNIVNNRQDAEECVNDSYLGAWNAIPPTHPNPSKRVPDKKYPVQVIKGLAGRIDEGGFHRLSKAFVETGHVVVRECGFTNFLLKFEDEYVSRRNERVKERRNLYRSMIVYLSNNSYLNDEQGTTIYSAPEMIEKFHIGIPNQVTAISRICEYDLKELEPLKYVCCVVMGNRVFESELTNAQKELMGRIGITENDIRQK